MSRQYQIKIPLNPSQIGPVTAWAKRFNDSDIRRLDEIQVLGNALLANAYDLSDFIKLADLRRSNEFDVFR